MQYKEHEFDKDKSLWIQKYELSSRELNETRQQLETQKLYYLQIIASLKFSSSPLKQPNMLEISPSLKKKLDESISFISEQEMIRQSLKIKGNEEKLHEILLRESVQLDIHLKAKEMAEALWRDKESDKLRQLKSQCEEAEEQLNN